MRVMLWSERLDICLTCSSCLNLLCAEWSIWDIMSERCFRCWNNYCIQHSWCCFRFSLREPYWDEFFIWIPEREKLSKTQQAILEFLRKHKGQKFCLSDLERKLGISINSIKSAVRALWKRKLIRRVLYASGLKTLVWVE